MEVFSRVVSESNAGADLLPGMNANSGPEYIEKTSPMNHCAKKARAVPPKLITQTITGAIAPVRMEPVFMTILLPTLSER